MWISGGIKVISLPIGSLKWKIGCQVWLWLWRMIHWGPSEGLGSGHLWGISWMLSPSVLPSISTPLPSHCSLCPRTPTDLDTISGIHCLVIPSWIWQLKSRDCKDGRRHGWSIYSTGSGQELVVPSLPKIPNPLAYSSMQLLFLGCRDYSLYAPSGLGVVVAPCCC